MHTSVISLSIAAIILQNSAPYNGFYLNPGAQHNQAIIQFCAKMPPTLISNRTVLIRLVSQQTLQADACSSGTPETDALGTIDGYYRSGGSLLEADGEIELSRALKGNRLRLVLAHEFGHFVWFERMSKRQRDAYRSLWKADKRTKHLVTQYAAVSAKEGFAEAFSWYVYQKNQLHRLDAPSWNFISRMFNKH